MGADLTQRELTRQQYQWLRHFGWRQFRGYVMDAYPVWDPLLALVIYRDQQPLIASSAAVAVLGARDRLDVDNFPDWGTPVELLPKISPESPYGAWGHCRNISVLSFGDFESPVAPEPVLQKQIDVFHSLNPLLLQIAQTRGAVAVDYKAVILMDGRKVLPNLGFTRALGYSDGDSSWVPGHWHRPVKAGIIETGFDIVRTGDAEQIPTLLRWLRMRINDRTNLYATRIMHPVSAGQIVSASVEEIPVGDVVVPSIVPELFTTLTEVEQQAGSRRAERQRRGLAGSAK